MDAPLVWRRYDDRTAPLRGLEGLMLPEEPKSAVALHYNPKSGDGAPCVVAKGQGAVAEEILRLAREHDVPLRQDPALAGALATLNIGMTIPPELFRAVAEVLAFIYKMNAKP